MAVNITARSDAAADVPAGEAKLIIDGATRQSAALSLFKKLPMSRRQERIRVLAALPTAYFVNGDTGTKQTSKNAWLDKLVTAEEIAVILPVPQAVIDDAAFDIWSYLRPDAEEAIGKALDEAIFFGINKPATWPVALIPAALAATPSHAATRGTAAQAAGGIAQDLNALMALIENDGFDANGIMASRSIRQYLRGARSTQGQSLAEFGMNGDTLMGMSIQYGARGSWPVGGVAGTLNPLALLGDFTQGVLGVRMDITAKMLTEAVIQDPTTNAIVYNLAQQDMVALRLVARFGFQVSNHVTWEQGTEANRFPFAVFNNTAV